MIVSETKIRVCYGDTDQMGIVYYGTYARYYEVGRNELIRSIGLTYRQLEEMGIMLPAHSLEIKYHRSAFYDDLLTVKTFVKSIPKVKFPIYSEIYNEEGVLINSGLVVLAFMNASTRKPCSIPPDFAARMKEFF
jgi:acyl-CoA thioester hydrolase